MHCDVAIIRKCCGHPIFVLHRYVLRVGVRFRCRFLVVVSFYSNLRTVEFIVMRLTYAWQTYCIGVHVLTGRCRTTRAQINSFFRQRGMVIRDSRLYVVVLRPFSRQRRVLQRIRRGRCRARRCIGDQRRLLLAGSRWELNVVFVFLATPTQDDPKHSGKHDHNSANATANDNHGQ